MLLTKRKIKQGESSRINIKLWGEDFWVLTKSGRNKYKFNNEQIAEVQRIRKFLTPNEIAETLGIGTFKVHKVINENEIMINIEVKKKGIHPISKKVQKKIDKINARVSGS
jgi:(p)ppGpp synthase/HD superfamily hydrolase